jgi:hypothetical protein
MRKLIALTLLTVSLAGCFVYGPPRRGYRACGPAYHWDGYNCVHNGRGREYREERREDNQGNQGNGVRTRDHGR